MNNKCVDPKSSGFPDSREEQVLVIKEMAIAARNGAASLDLDFAAYLLDMVVLSLSDQLGEETQGKNRT